MTNTFIIGKHKTKVYDEGGWTCVKYWDTIVVKFNEDQIILNSGGWETLTTKKRINQASNSYNLDFHLWQEKSQWFITLKGKDLFGQGIWDCGDRVLFKDEMILNRRNYGLYKNSKI